jgi:hypothetical protein
VRSPEDSELTERIRRAPAASKGTYGAPPICAELAARGRSHRQDAGHPADARLR